MGLGELEVGFGVIWVGGWGGEMVAQILYVSREGLLKWCRFQRVFQFSLDFLLRIDAILLRNNF